MRSAKSQREPNEERAEQRERAVADALEQFLGSFSPSLTCYLPVLHAQEFDMPGLPDATDGDKVGDDGGGDGGGNVGGDGGGNVGGDGGGNVGDDGGGDGGGNETAPAALAVSLPAASEPGPSLYPTACHRRRTLYMRVHSIYTRKIATRDRTAR